MSIFETSIFGIHIAPTWYWLMYALGFIICYVFVKKRTHIPTNDLDILLFFIFLWVILGGRLGYVLFYNLPYYIENPREIFSIWKGGMSFHGGFLWVMIALWWFSLRRKYSFFFVSDALALIIPIALGLWRIGNYINGELPGFTPYNGPFALVINGISYFPSTLLEMCLEWILLFFILAWISKWLSHRSIGQSGILSACFLIGYSVMRFISEMFRLPDEHIGYIFGTSWITLGMLYTLPILITWVVILWKMRVTTPIR